LDVLAGDKGKKQKEKEAQKNWFANKVWLLYFSSVVVLIAFARSTRWLAEARLGNSTRISWIRVLERFIVG
jgi:hypothetical protein